MCEIIYAENYLELLADALLEDKPAPQEPITYNTVTLTAEQQALLDDALLEDEPEPREPINYNTVKLTEEQLESLQEALTTELYPIVVVVAVRRKHPFQYQ
jgi:hypothetical protein